MNVSFTEKELELLVGALNKYLNASSGPIIIEEIAKESEEGLDYAVYKLEKELELNKLGIIR